MKVRCLSVRQPYAALLVAGLKTIETRSWHTQYRGPILIHASARSAHLPEDFKAILKDVSTKLLDARGAIIGRVTLTDCRPLLVGDRAKALCEFADGHFAWIVEQPVAFEELLPLKGRLGLFEIPAPCGGCP
jgi:hypothetical protein